MDAKQVDANLIRQTEALERIATAMVRIADNVPNTQQSFNIDALAVWIADYLHAPGSALHDRTFQLIAERIRAWPLINNVNS